MCRAFKQSFAQIKGVYGIQAEKHVIWSDLDLDYEDWREYLEAEYPNRTEAEYRALMQEINAEYLEDERSNLDIQLSMPILACADLGLWNGRKTGYKVIESGNIRDCLWSGCDYKEWFVDQKGDLRCTAVHHDGTNHYLYRAVREGMPEWKVEKLLEKLYSGKATETDIARVTRRLGDEIAAVYGYAIPEADEKEVEHLDSIDVQKEVFEEVEILGHQALFTELRVDKGTIPEGVFCYALRHGDDDSYPATLENDVGVNYFGSVLLTEEITLDKMKMRSVDYEDFWYIGEEMKLSDFMEKQKCIPFMKASELTAFMKRNGISMQMTEREAEILLGYMDGHGCMIGHKGEEILCMDVCAGEDEQVWKPYSLDDAINDACGCNYDMIQQAQQELESVDQFDEYGQVNARLNSLREDEKVLDVMFERTKYGKEVEQLAEKLADEFIRDMGSKDGIDGAIQRMTEAIREGKDLLPDVSPALKKDRGAR